MNALRPRTAAWIGSFLTALPASIQALWIRAYQVAEHQQGRVQEFHKHLPEFLQAPTHAVLFAAACCLLALPFCTRGVQAAGAFWKVMCLALLVVDLLLLPLFVFQLM